MEREKRASLYTGPAVPTREALAQALRRSGGLCMCACGREAEVARRVFPAAIWPELRDHTDNWMLLSIHHAAAGIPRRATRHAALLADDSEKRQWLREQYPC